MTYWRSPSRTGWHLAVVASGEDTGLTTQIGIDVIDEQWMALGDISGSHLDLLERQLLILQRAIAPSDDDTPQGFLPF